MNPNHTDRLRFLFDHIIVISLVFITIGEDDEKMFTDLAPLLKYTITNHDQGEVKAAVSEKPRETGKSTFVFIALVPV